MFLCAKSASAATAALGFTGYILVAAGSSTSTYRVALPGNAAPAVSICASAQVGPAAQDPFSAPCCGTGRA